MSKSISNIKMDGVKTLDGKYEWLAHNIFKNYERNKILDINDLLDEDYKSEIEVKHPLDVYDKILYSESELMVYIQNREIIPSNNDDKKFKIPNNNNGYEITLLFRNKELNNNCWLILNKKELTTIFVDNINETEQALNSIFTGIPEIRSLFVPDNINEAGIDSDEFYNFIANNVSDSSKSFWKWEDSYTTEHKMVSLISCINSFDKDTLKKEWDNYNHLSKKASAIVNTNHNKFGSIVDMDHNNIEEFPVDVRQFALKIKNFDWKCSNTPHNAVLAMGSSKLLKFCIDCVMELPNVKVNVKKHNTMNLYKVANTKYVTSQNRNSTKLQLVSIAKNLAYGNEYKSNVKK